jgi:acetoin utilization deacetylase AcuC-like enzyme
MSSAVGYAYDPVFLKHDFAGHPEHAGRLKAIHALLEARGMLAELRKLQAEPATFDELCELHTPEYVSQIYMLAERGGGRDGDTYVARESFAAAASAVGATMRCARAVMQGEVQRAFALVRPPGHHAFAAHGEGFCLFNNIAFAARVALGKGTGGDLMWSPSAVKSHAREQARAMIIDFDVHHGNGTQSIFEDDASVMMLSLHQFGYIYPGSGQLDEVGHGPGRGATINLPMPAGAGDAAYARAFAEIVRPAAMRFKPDVLLVSAGFDAHWRDPLAAVNVSLRGFAEMLGTLCELSEALCGGRMVVVLEGGYDLDALSYGVLNTFNILRGYPERVEDPLGPAPGHDTDAGRVIEAVKRTHGI